MTDTKHIHLTAICGMGMGAFAGILKQAGFRVTGSDQNVYPPMSDKLAEMGIEIMSPYSPDNIEDSPDMVIVGNAIKKDNPEILAVIEKGIPYMSFPQALETYFLKEKKSLVVAGTHGKTTTSSLLAWTLEENAMSPSFLIGGLLHNFGTSCKLGEGEYFVVEGDEYDTAFFDKIPKFMHYCPKSAILTNVEFDHGDIYRDIDHVKDAFRSFVKLIPNDGYLIACTDFPHVKDVIKSAKCRVESYGLSPDCDWTLENMVLGSESSRFTVLYKNKVLGDFKILIPGKHNITNALATIALLYHQGLTIEGIARGLATFTGIKRRQEVRGVVNGVTVIDDFAHHPTKVRETVCAIRSKYNNGKLWAIFEPRTNTSRRAFFQNDYVNSFDDAEKVVVAGVFNEALIDQEDRFSPVKLTKDLSEKGKDAYFIPLVDDIVSFICERVQSGDVILVMSNGGFDSIHEKLLAELGSAKIAV